MPRLIWKEPHASSDAEELHFPYVVSVVPSPCEDCNKDCEKLRVVNSRRNTNPAPYWRSQCSVCKMYLNPETGVYDLNQAQVRKYYQEKLKG